MDNNTAIDLSFFTKKGYSPQASKFKQILWYFMNIIFFCCRLNVSSGLKVFLLRLFGAKIGKNVYVKPAVNIKFPWKLSIGNDTWIGENVWIDNLEFVTIGNNACISQASLLLTGNHNYTISSFDYRNAPIIIEDGAWIGAKSVVCPGVTVKSHAILTVGSIATKSLEAYTIYQGNPAQPIRKRVIRK